MSISNDFSHGFHVCHRNIANHKILMLLKCWAYDTNIEALLLYNDCNEVISCFICLSKEILTVDT